MFDSYRAEKEVPLSVQDRCDRRWQLGVLGVGSCKMFVVGCWELGVGSWELKLVGSWKKSGKMFEVGC